MLRTAIAAATLLLAACSSALGPEPNTFHVARVPTGVVLVNGTSAPVFHLMVEQETLPVINWAPCVDLSRCDPLMPGDTAHRGLDRVIGYSAERGRQTAVIFWWTAVPDLGGGVKPGPVRTLTLKL